MEQKKGLTLDQLKRLDRLRNAYNNRIPHITKKALAAECHYGERYIAHLFAGTRPVSNDAIEVLAPALLVRREYLYGIDDVMTDQEYKRRKDFTDSFTALMEYAVKNTMGRFEYRFISPETDLSEYKDELNDWDLSFLQMTQSEGLRAIMQVKEDPFGDEEYDFSVVDDDVYYRLVRDICDFITLRVAHSFNENQMKTFMDKMELVMPLLRDK